MIRTRSIAKYSFIQLCELEQCRANELANVLTRQHNIRTPTLFQNYIITIHINVISYTNVFVSEAHIMVQRNPCIDHTQRHVVVKYD